MVPEASTIPIDWSILTMSAPVTFHDRVDVPSELRLLLNSVITGGIRSGDGGAALTVVTTDLVMLPAVLVALIVKTVDVVGDTTLVPATSTCPIPWSILTDVAPVTFHNKVDVPPALMVDGLLLNAMITGGFPTGVIGFGDGDTNVTQPGMKMNNSRNNRGRKVILFNVVTSNYMLPVKPTSP